MAKCIFCDEEAIYFRPYSGERYCKRCYLRTVEKQVQRTITSHRMLRPDDRIALALSGGKDSVSLLHILTRLEKNYPRSEIVAITIDEGITGYRSEAIKIAKNNCEKLGVEHRVYPFKMLYGHTLDEVTDAAKKRRKPFICSFCGILRRKALNIAAKEADATKLVTAHNLDDEVQSMMMNLLRGDMVRMASRERGLNEKGGWVPRVKPLCEVPERDVALYTFLKKIKFQSVSCPYLETSLRSDVRRFLNMMNSKHPGMKLTLYRSFEKIRPDRKFLEERVVGRCSICGEPTVRPVCMACQILKDLI